MEIPVSNADIVDPDQMMCSATSDLGLQCFPVAHLGVPLLKWVTVFYLITALVFQNYWKNL